MGGHMPHASSNTGPFSFWGKKRHLASFFLSLLWVLELGHGWFAGFSVFAGEVVVFPIGPCL